MGRLTEMTGPADNAGRKQRGRPFMPGQSGNPAGMAAGSRHKATKLLDAIGEAGAESVLQATLQAAQTGDMAAARIILDRVWPARKGRAVPLALPPIDTPADLRQAMAALLGAVAAGTITPDEGQAVAALLEAHRRMMGSTDDESLHDPDPDV